MLHRVYITGALMASDHEVYTSDGKPPLGDYVAVIYWTVEQILFHQ